MSAVLFMLLLVVSDGLGLDWSLVRRGTSSNLFRFRSTIAMGHYGQKCNFSLFLTLITNHNPISNSNFVWTSAPLD